MAAIVGRPAQRGKRRRSADGAPALATRRRPKSDAWFSAPRIGCGRRAGFAAPEALRPGCAHASRFPFEAVLEGGRHTGQVFSAILGGQRPLRFEAR
jgi:hypothetical protein